MELTAPC